MTFFESVHHFHAVWLSLNPDIGNSNIFWRFSREGWRAYQMSKPPVGSGADTIPSPGGQAVLLHFAVEIIDDDTFWYDLIFHGKAVKIPGRFPFNKSSILQ